MDVPVIFAEWGGRAAGVDRVAEALEATIDAVPMPPITGDGGWFELHSRTPVPTEHEAWVDLVESHRERDSQGAIEPLAGFTVSLARGDEHTSDEAIPYVSVLAMVGGAISGPRTSANRVDVTASSGWVAAVPQEERVATLQRLVEVWRPSFAVVVDSPLMRGRSKVRGRTPWPGYASWFADAVVPKPVLSDAFRVSRFAGGTLAVLEGPWEASRVIEEIPRFLDGSTYERIPQKEGEADRTT